MRARRLPSREGALEWLRIAGALGELGIQSESTRRVVGEFTRACLLVRHPGLERDGEGWRCRACGGESLGLDVLMEASCA